MAWRSEIQLDTKLDVVDHDHKWCWATVIDCDKAKVHFNGFPDRFDMWLDVKNCRIAPHGHFNDGSNRLGLQFDETHVARMTGSGKREYGGEDTADEPVEEWRSSIAIGTKLDVLDEDKRWAYASVIDAGKVKVHFDGFPARFDTWVDRNSEDIAERGTRHDGKLRLGTPREGKEEIKEPAPDARINCAGNHGLERFETEEDDFFCDICGETYPAGTVMRGCRVCDWDICDSCHSKQPSTPEPVAEPPIDLQKSLRGAQVLLSEREKDLENAQFAVKEARAAVDALKKQISGENEKQQEAEEEKPVPEEPSTEPAVDELDVPKGSRVVLHSMKTDRYNGEWGTTVTNYSSETGRIGVLFDDKSFGSKSIKAANITTGASILEPTPEPAAEPEAKQEEKQEEKTEVEIAAVAKPIVSGSRVVCNNLDGDDSKLNGEWGVSTGDEDGGSVEVRFDDSRLGAKSINVANLTTGASILQPAEAPQDSAEESAEVQRLKKENDDLEQAIAEKDKEIEEWTRAKATVDRLTRENSDIEAQIAQKDAELEGLEADEQKQETPPETAPAVAETTPETAAEPEVAPEATPEAAPEAAAEPEAAPAESEEKAATAPAGGEEEKVAPQEVAPQDTLVLPGKKKKRSKKDKKYATATTVDMKKMISQYESGSAEAENGSPESEE